jgi:predicted metal-dependent hydrolase
MNKTERSPELIKRLMDAMVNIGLIPVNEDGAYFMTEDGMEGIYIDLSATDEKYFAIVAMKQIADKMYHRGANNLRKQIKELLIPNY